MQRIITLAGVALLAAAFAPSIPGTPKPSAQPAESASFPESLVDIDGNTLDVAKLAKEHSLVVVTLKAPWCQVCTRQLLRINSRLDELEMCDVTFIVLAPGTRAELGRVREETRFDFPFVADEKLEVAESLDLVMAPGQIFPCMFHVEADLRIGWRQLGRNGAYFGDGALTDYFDCVHI